MKVHRPLRASPVSRWLLKTRRRFADAFRPEGGVVLLARRLAGRFLSPIADHPWLKAGWLLQKLPPGLRDRIPPFLELPPLEPEGTILPEALAYQGALVHLLQEPLPPGLRGTIRWCGTLIGLGLLISILFKVDVVVAGQGKLTYDGPPIVLQPFERAVLRSLLVKPGDAVAKGQVLATLDPTFSQADLSALESRTRMTRALLKRLECESNGVPYKPDAEDAEAGQLQAQIHKQRLAEYASRLRAFDETLGETEAGVVRVQGDIKNFEEQLQIFQQMEEMQEKLYKFKTNSQLEYLAARGNRLRADREFKEATERLVELRHRSQTVQAQRDGFLQEWRRTLFEELNRQRAERAQLDSSRTKLERVNNLIVISAPEDGVVLDIANRSVGSVLREAEPLVILIPTTVPLISEIQLGSSSVGEAAVGDRVLVKIDAYPFQRYGGLEGRIRSISYESHAGGGASDLESVANKRANAAGGGMHRVVIGLETTRPERLPEHRKLFPGMTVTGEIHLGKRRIINYVLLPLLRGLNESFREP
jgi:hemolysin D